MKRILSLVLLYFLQKSLCNKNKINMQVSMCKEPLKESFSPFKKNFPFMFNTMQTISLQIFCVHQQDYNRFLIYVSIQCNLVCLYYQSFGFLGLLHLWNKVRFFSKVVQVYVPFISSLIVCVKHTVFCFSIKFLSF